MTAEIEVNSNKAHRERKAGKKAEKKKDKNKHVQDLTAQQRNPKGFAFNSIVKTQRKIARTQDLKTRKHHIPVVNRTPLEPPPILVAVTGGQQVGKSTLIRSLIKNYTRQRIANIEGPITVVAGKKQRITFVEVKKDVNSMTDIAKIADVILMIIDINHGIELDLFELLEMCRSYGQPRIMGILNHIDTLKNSKGLNKKKKELTHRFQVELYPGAKLFYLRGLIHGEYLKNEISNLGRFISVLKFRPLQFRSTHPYVLVDRMEDITNVETIRQNSVCDRNVVLYGYVRGIPMQQNQNVHIPGVGDFCIKDISILDDPCPLPDTLKKRSLNSKERLLYAPMSGVAGVIYDKDAIYIDLGGSHHGKKNGTEENGDDEDGVNQNNLLDGLLQKPLISNAEKIQQKGVKLFSYSKVIPNTEECLKDDDDDDDDEEEEEEEDKSDDENSESEEEERAPPKFEMQTDQFGNKRRKVLFEDEVAGEEEHEGEGDSDYESENLSDEEDSQSEEEDDNEFIHPQKKRKMDEEKEGFEKMGKEISLPGISLSQSDSNRNYDLFLQNIIYRDAAKFNKCNNEETKPSEDEEYNGYDLFRKATYRNAFGEKSSNFHAEAESNEMDVRKRITSWMKKNKEEADESFRDIFVTGEWSESESAQKLLKLDKEDEDLYGDFEDLESGTKFKAEQNSQEEDKKEEKKGKDEEKTAKEKRREKKLRLKALFDTDYDGNGDGDYFDTLKAEMNEQAELNKTEFEGLDDETRVQLEGYRVGVYVRMEFEGMPCELITNFDPCYSLIVGGLLPNEMEMGFIQVRMKVHRWFPKILKNKDPLYVSLGWKRFQTMMFYAKREDNFRLRSLKYARKYIHVDALFWGPRVHTSSGFVAIQDINVQSSSFSIAATGVVLGPDLSTKLVKKLKLIGYPEKIYQKTAFIKDMFHTDTEVTKFEGVKLQTQSSIRGVIKKAIGLQGVFRATFEDVIKLSDTIILATWTDVEIPKFCSIVKNLLLPKNQKSTWQGMKTNAQMRRQLKIENPPLNPDSVYTKIEERREYVHMPLKIPKKLQAALPFKDKPKNTPSIKKQQRVFVVKDPEEVKMENFMSNLKVMMKDNMIKKKIARKEKHKVRRKEMRKVEEKKNERVKKKKAFVCKNRSLKKSKST